HKTARSAETFWGVASISGQSCQRSSAGRRRKCSILPDFRRFNPAGPPQKFQNSKTSGRCTAAIHHPRYPDQLSATRRDGFGVLSAVCWSLSGPSMGRKCFTNEGCS
ncbi:unnamed protein product, partial [Ectocarpus sp. 8 AP-2014]